MKYKIRHTNKTQKTIEFHISKELVSGELNRIYQEISKTASLPGFRTGKAPIELVKKRYKKEVRDEAVSNLLTDSFRKAIKESDINMLGFPEISDLEFDEERGMSYKITVNIKPEIKLKNYKRLNLKKIDKEVKESDIDSEIDNLREANAKFITKERNAASGDYIICDVECAIENSPLEKKENIWLYVGDEAFIPGRSLEGLRRSDEKDIEKVLPTGYSKKELAGKIAKFHIKVKEVKEKILPELDEEFLATLGNFKSIAELRESIRRMIKRRNEIEERRELENQVLKLLDKMAIFDAPQFMVDEHHERLVNETKEWLKLERYPEDQINSMEKAIRKILKTEALREVRTYFILDEIAKLEDIGVDNKEIEDTFKIIASFQGRSVEEIRKHYKEKDLIDDLREEIRQGKVIDFIIRNADIS